MEKVNYAKKLLISIDYKVQTSKITVSSQG